jgi:hypothetical protein
MWEHSTGLSLAAAVVEFTPDFALFLLGLVGLVGLSAGMIAWEALRHARAGRSQPLTATPAAAAPEREAA